MFFIILILSILISFLTAYTMSIQSTTLAIGHLLVSKKINTSVSEVKSTGVQDAITPKSQTIRNILMYTLYIIMFGIVTFTYAWYHALWVLIVIFYSASMFHVTTKIKPGSTWAISIIIADMKKRYQNYQRVNDMLRAQLIKELINQAEQLSPEEILKEVSR